MAKRLTVLNTYRPRIKRGPLVEPEELARRLAARSRYSVADATALMIGLGEEALYLLRTGRSVRLAGLGKLQPNVDAAGELSVTFVLDRKALALAAAGGASFLGALTNGQYRHTRPDELIELWNAEHPDDPVVD